MGNSKLEKQNEEHFHACGSFGRYLSFGWLRI